MGDKMDISGVYLYKSATIEIPASSRNWVGEIPVCFLKYLLK